MPADHTETILANADVTLKQGFNDALAYDFNDSEWKQMTFSTSEGGHGARNINAITKAAYLASYADFESFLISKSEVFPYQASDDADTQKQAFSSEWQLFLDSEFGTDSVAEALSYVDDDGEIRFYAIKYDTALPVTVFEVDDFSEYRDKVEDFISDASELCPDALCESMFQTNIFWFLITMINAFISSSMKGIAIALPLAFVVMLISTHNWIISVFATLDVVGVMLTEFGILFAAGYVFGLIESIGIVVIIGFSVDYVVHLANAYLESAAHSREDRLSIALLTIGISVLSGATTTFLCGLVLCFTEVLFFKTMGVIMYVSSQPSDHGREIHVSTTVLLTCRLTTVLVSIAWAMFCFTAMCAALGPEGDAGDLKKYWKRWAPAKCGGKGEDSNAEGTPKEKLSPKDQGNVELAANTVAVVEEQAES